MRVIFCLVLLILCSLTRAQQPFYITYNDENGLLDNEVYDLHQDKKGFIWIAGNNGLSRFNGQRFVSYQSSEKRSSSLAEIQEDSFGHLWMHDFTDRIFCVEHDSLLNLQMYESKSGNFPINYLDALNRLWVVVNDRITCFQVGKRFAETRMLKDIQQVNYRSVFVHKDVLYCTAENKILAVNRDFSLDTIPIRLHTSQDVLSGWSAFFEKDGTLHLLILREKAIYKLSDKGFVFEQRLNVEPDIIALRTIGKQQWVLTRSGAYCFSDSFARYKRYFPDVPISDVIKDKDGGYWFSTLTNGVFYVPGIEIEVYHTGKIQGGFTSIYQANDRLYLGAFDGGIYTINKQKELINLHRAEVNKEVSFIYQTPDGKQLYWGNSNLYCQTNNTQPELLASNPGTRQISWIGYGQFLFTSSDGLMVFSRENLKPGNLVFKHAKLLKGVGYFKAQLLSSRTSCFYYNAHDSSVVAVTKTGVVRIGQTGQTPIRMNNTEIYATAIAGNGTCVWFGTLSAGLLKWDNGSVFPYDDINKKLVSLQIQKVVYEDGFLLVAHPLGVQVFHLKSGMQYNCLKSDGLFNSKINSAALFNKRLYIAGNKGALVVPLEQLLRTSTVPKLYITTVNGRETTSVVLHNTKRLAIHYQLVAFRQREFTKIRYRFEEEEQWNEATLDQEEILFNNLPNGSSRLFIQAYNSLTGMVSETAIVEAEVIPPFWQTWWFFSLLAIVSIGSIALLAQWRIRILARKNKELLERETLNKDLKSSMLASIKSQMNPHFIFNALNTIQSYVLQNDRMQANFYLGKFSDLMRKILNMSTRDTIGLEEEIQTLKLYLELENMRFNGVLNYHIELLDDDMMQYEIPSMIIQPYVENAIKHGLLHKQGDKVLNVSFIRQETKLLKVVIFDNGIGRKAAAQIKSRQAGRTPSFSSDANRRRLELLNESLSTNIGLEVEDLLEGTQPMGTRVSLYIPLR